MEESRKKPGSIQRDADTFVRKGGWMAMAEQAPVFIN
jgi:hypothetical protein